MQRFRNAVFILLACAIVFSCIGNKIADRVLNVVDAPKTSLLEGRKYQEFPKLNSETIMNGSFQKRAEQYIADLVPMRDSVLLANAQTQRLIIRIANLMPDYSAYPTFFDSKYYRVTDEDHVIEAPGDSTYYNEKRYIAAAENYNELFENNSSICWFVYMPERGVSSAGNPLHSMFSDVVDYGALENNFLKRLKGASILNGRIDTTEEFFEKRYMTDHHWNARGAVAGYESIMKALNREPISFEGYRTVFNDNFYGSAARRGLCLTKSGDSIEDAIYQHSDIEISINGKAVEPDKVNEAWNEDGGASFEKSGQCANVYADFFHGDVAEISFHNDSGTGNLLILGDSFTDCMDRFFAESYENVWVLDLRRYKGSAQEFINSHDIDDAVVLMCCTNLLEEKIYTQLNDNES